jgi:exosortase H (IPTLxxWG-CTERM-specific)
MTVRRERSRPELRFLFVFLGTLCVGFSALALAPVDEAVVGPLTDGVARVSGAALAALGEDITVAGRELRSPRFAVSIHNGCNGLVTGLVLAAAMLAFPGVPWPVKATGVVVGLAAIQLANLVRVVALFYTGVYLPEVFNEAHVVVWQTVVILSAVALWIVWARWAVTRARTTR